MQDGKIDDANRVYDNLLEYLKEKRMKKEVIDSWLINFKDGKFSDIKYPSSTGFISNTEPLYIHLNRTKSIANFIFTLSENERIYYIICASDALNFYVNQNYKTSNWWHRRIGLAKVSSGAAVLLSSNILDKKQLLPFINYIKKVIDEPEHKTAANLSDFLYSQILWGAMGWKLFAKNNYLDALSQASSQISELCLPVDGVKEGVRIDYSYSQHNPRDKYSQIYTGGYGLVFVRNIFMFYSILTGFFAIDRKSKQELEKFIINGMAWCSYANNFDFHVYGRGTGREHTLINICT